MKQLFFLAICIGSLAVNRANAQVGGRDAVMDRQFGIIREMPQRPPKLVGSVYLDESWNGATLYTRKGKLSVDSIVDVQAKLDLKLNQFEIFTPQGVKVLPGEKVDSLYLGNPRTGQTFLFINCDLYQVNGVKGNGFARLLTSGKIPLVERCFVEVKKADYNVALDVGSTDDKIVKREQLYVILEGKMIEAEKRALLQAMADHQEPVKSYVKANKLNFKNMDDLQKILMFYYSL